MENLFGGLLKVKKTEKNLNFCLLYRKKYGMIIKEVNANCIKILS